MTEIEWVSIPPGAVEMGSDNRSVLFGNLGPRHIFTINSPFEISKYPVESDLAREVLAQDEAHVASESEWERAMSIGAITGEIGTIEVLADSATNYWGKHCDGRPFIQENPIRTRRVRRGRKGEPRNRRGPSSQSKIFQEDSSRELRITMITCFHFQLGQTIVGLCLKKL